MAVLCIAMVACNGNDPAIEATALPRATSAPATAAVADEATGTLTVPPSVTPSPLPRPSSTLPIPTPTAVTDTSQPAASPTPAGLTISAGIPLFDQVSTPAASADLPQGQIVFSSCLPPCREADIFVMDSDGGNLVNLTSALPGYAGEAAWSPDGATIAFAVTEPETETQNSQIYTLSPDGANLMPLIATGGQKSRPVWSPAGQALAFFNDQAAEGSATVRIDLYTLADRLTTSIFAGEGVEAGSLLFSPDGEYLAFTLHYPPPAGGAGAGEKLFTVRVDGTELTPLLPAPFAGSSPVWSGDGEQLLFSGFSIEDSAEDNEPGLYVVGRDGSNLTRLTGDFGIDFNPAWSPDNTRLAWVNLSSSAGYRLIVGNGDATGPVQLAEEFWSFGRLVWLPDGRWLLFEGFREQDAGRQLYLLDTLTNSWIQITEGIAEPGITLNAWRDGN